MGSTGVFLPGPQACQAHAFLGPPLWALWVCVPFYKRLTAPSLGQASFLELCLVQPSPSSIFSVAYSPYSLSLLSLLLSDTFSRDSTVLLLYPFNRRHCCSAANIHAPTSQNASTLQSTKQQSRASKPSLNRFSFSLCRKHIYKNQKKVLSLQLRDILRIPASSKQATIRRPNTRDNQQRLVNSTRRCRFQTLCL